MDTHQVYLQISWIFSWTSTSIKKKWNKMLLSRMHNLRIFQLFPCLNAIQQLLLTFLPLEHIHEFSVKDSTYLHWLRLTKTSMTGWTRLNNEETLFFQSSKSNPHTKMCFRIERFENGYLNDRNISLGIHNHHRNKNSMIVPAFRVCLEIHFLFLQLCLHMVSKLGRTFDWISEIVCLCRKTIIVIIERRNVMVNDGPLMLFPMCWKKQDGLRFRKLRLDVLKLFEENGMIFFVDKRHWASSVGHKNWCHDNKVWL